MSDLLKQSAARSAMQYVQDDMIVGVGTGSTVFYFIQELAKIKHKIEGAVASSIQTETLLKQFSIPIIDLNSVVELPVYVDGADAINPLRQMLKGGGAAHTREKCVASLSKQFICIVDPSKCVPDFSELPIAIEVLPVARSMVARELVKMGGTPVYRESVVSDYGNVILDVYGLDRRNLLELEIQLKSLLGVVESGIFAKRIADVVCVGK